MTTREKFVERFGETEAALIEQTANGHRYKERDNPFEAVTVLMHGAQPKKAEDQFLLDISTCISWECLTKFHEWHGFAHTVESLQEWIRANAIPPEEYRDPASPYLYQKYLGENPSIGWIVSI